MVHGGNASRPLRMDRGEVCMAQWHAESADTLSRAYTPMFCISTFTLHTVSLQSSAVYFQSTDLLSASLILSGLTKCGIYFASYFAGPGGHGCPKGGHVCPPRLVVPAPWGVKGEGGSAKLRCIRARGSLSPFIYNKGYGCEDWRMTVHVFVDGDEL